MKRPLLYIAISFSTGIVISNLFNTPILYPFLLSLLFIAIASLRSNSRMVSHLSVYLAIVFLGVAHYQYSNILPADHIANFTHERPERALLKGVVLDDPLITEGSYGRDKASFVLKAQAIKEGADWQKTTGLVEVSLYLKERGLVNFGDEVILQGLLSRPLGLKNPGLFDYSKYLAKKNIYSVLRVKDESAAAVVGGSPSNPIKALAYRMRGAIRLVLDKYLDEPDRGFIKAILIGERASLKYGLNDDFIKTGTVHILSISGLHVAIIAALVLAMFGAIGIPKKFNLILTMVFLVFYSYIAGSSPPIIRSVIMFFVFAIGYLIQRKSDMLNSLAASALLILLWNPNELFDPSFQLSFGSVASMIIFAPKIDGIFRVDAIGRSSVKEKALRYLLKGISVSLAAWIGTWPIVSAYFNITSPVAVVANLVIIPMSFVSMAVSMLLLFASPVSAALANGIGLALSFADKLMFFTNHALSQIPFAYFRTPAPSAEYMALYYALVLLWVVPGPFGFRRINISRRAVLISILLVLNILTWRECAFSGGDELKVTFLDVGQGDSALVEFPGGGNMLIDAGSGGDSFDMGRLVVAPYLWNRGISHIDAVVVTHSHEDHLGGIIYVLKNFSVGAVIDNGVPDNKSFVYDEYMRTIREKRMDHIVVGEGETIGPFRDAKVFVLNPPEGETPSETNDGSIVLKIEYKRSGILFCGDVTSKAMEHLLYSYGSFLRSDVIKVPHHGAKLGDYNTVKSFFSTISPAVSIISAGRFNRYRAPSADTVQIISSLKSSSYATNKNGAIILVVKSGSYSIVPFLKENQLFYTLP